MPIISGRILPCEHNLCSLSHPMSHHCRHRRLTAATAATASTAATAAARVITSAVIVAACSRCAIALATRARASPVTHLA